MNHVAVNKDYLAKLALQQQKAAEAFTAAKADVQGIAESVSSTHGFACQPTVKAMKEVEAALSNAITAMAQCASRLETKLKDAESLYRSTDNEVL